MPLNELWERARDTVHPAAIRFRRFLRSLPLDLESLPDPLPDLGPDEFIICGCPRTGTSLLAALLFQPPHVVTVVEPWDGLRMPPTELFRSLRDEITSTGALSRGTLDIPSLRQAHTVRRVAEGSGAAPVPTSPGWQLGVKWPAYFQLIPRMPNTRFLVCLRDPSDTVASFKAIGGAVRRGYEYDVAFNRALNRKVRESATSAAQRRAALYGVVHEQLASAVSRPNVLTVRYERWFSDRDRQWFEIGEFLGLDLEPIAVPLKNDPKRVLLDAADLDAIRRRCTIARELGYALPT